MGMLGKVLMNYSFRALRVLGPIGYVRFIVRSALGVPRIIKEHNLHSIDQSMGALSSPVRCHMYGKTFYVDTRFGDSRIQDGTFTFGLIRELYFRNCYLRGAGLMEHVRQFRVVLDIGTNRGVFAAMMSPFAEKIVCVEVRPKFIDVIRRNMAINGFDRFHIENSFIGSGGVYESHAQNVITMEKLFQKYDIQKVDLVKLDIEGSEFILFKESDWLMKVDALCMEVHSRFGRVQDILDVLTQRGFEVEYANSRFRPVTDAQRAEFIWARRPAKNPR